MNRNVESHFSMLPSAEISRSTFDMSSSVKTSFNTGELVPFYINEVLPGDTFKVKSSKVVRLQTPLTPFMDNIYLDTYYFFVPNRLVWNHWKEFMGENTESAWIPQTEYQIPTLRSPNVQGWQVGTIADYFGIPTGITNLYVNALPFRAYALICNEWFRDQNLMDPLVISKDDVNRFGVNSDSFITDVELGGMPFIVSKYHDYFTSALPSPQKGPDVLIPGALTGTAIPVYTGTDHGNREPFMKLIYSSDAGNTYNSYAENLTISTGASTVNRTILGSNVGTPIAPTNLWAINSGGEVSTINQLREAFQIQKFFEKDARSGSRYIEVIKAHFGITSPDARLQRPEYLGGNRIPVNVNQVIQNSATENSGTPQGHVTAMSLTTDVNHDFVHSFVEHGFVIGVMCARYDHTYQQGLERMWSRKSKFDFYWPLFANLGEQAILNKEIFAQGNTAINPDSNKPYDEEVFGYQEAWAEYRYKPNHVTGEMRSQYVQSLDSWHLADDYESLPHLSAEWIREDKNTVDRVLAVSSRVSDQFFADIYVENIATRPMPLYSIPGLIDHH